MRNNDLVTPPASCHKYPAGPEPAPVAKRQGLSSNRLSSTYW